MRVLLINPQIGFSPPFGLLYLASYLESRGSEVQILELPTYNQETLICADLVKERLAKWEPELIGITCLTAYMPIVSELVRIIKERNPRTMVVLGGYHPTALPEESLQTGADIVVMGEGEHTLCEIIKAIESGRDVSKVQGTALKKNGSLILSAKRDLIRDLDTLPRPAYHLIDLDHYIMGNYAIRGKWYRCGWVMTSRGCPGRCTFCASDLIHGHRIRERSIPDVIDELCGLADNSGIEAFWILDDTFTLKESRVEEFCTALSASGRKLYWGCQARVNTFTENMARVIKEHGCLQVDFGVESGSQKVLNAIRKGITVEQTIKAFDICHSVGLRPLATVMIGNPEETREDVEMTRRLLDRIKPAYTGVFFATPYPGTQMLEQAIKNDWVDLETITWEHIEKPSMEIFLTKEEQEELYTSLVKTEFIKTVAGYMFNRRFLRAFAGMCLRDRHFFMKVTGCLARGKLKDAINLFREERILGYSLRQSEK